MKWRWVPVLVCILLGLPTLAAAGDLRAGHADLAPGSEPWREASAGRGARAPMLPLPAPAPFRSPAEFPGIAAIPDKASGPRVLALPLDQAAGLGVRVAADSAVVAVPHQRSDDDLSLIGLIELRQPLN